MILATTRLCLLGSQDRVLTFFGRVRANPLINTNRAYVDECFSRISASGFLGSHQFGTEASEDKDPS